MSRAETAKPEDVRKKLIVLESTFEERMELFHRQSFEYGARLAIWFCFPWGGYPPTHVRSDNPRPTLVDFDPAAPK